MSTYTAEAEARQVERFREKVRRERARNRREAERRERVGSSRQKGRRKSLRVPYAIMRTQKIKSIADVGRAQRHIQRTQRTPNADASRQHLNRVIFGSPSLAADVQAKIGDRKVRKNAVVCIEQILTASPEYFRPDDPDAYGKFNKKRLVDFIRKAQEYIKKEWGDNAVHATLHLDEATPHFHVFIVPLDYSKDPKGKLNARKFLGGPEKMSELQDRFAEHMRPLGLQRGQRKSKAKHQTVKRWYGTVDEDRRPYRFEQYQVSPPGLRDRLDPAGYAQGQVNQAIAQVEQAAGEIARLETEKAILRERLIQAERRAEALNGLADRMRDLDLREVASALGAIRDTQDKAKFRFGAVEVSITGQKFYDYHSETGGGGAIDLVMHTHNCKFRDAVRRLSKAFGPEKAAAAAAAKQYQQSLQVAKEEPLAFVAPARSENPAHLETVVTCFVEERAIPESVVRELIARGDLYAEARAGKNTTLVNAVMVIRDAVGNPVGAELIGMHQRADGSRFKGAAPGTDTGGGVFEYGPEHPEKIALVESAIDAISYTLLHPNHLAISTSGVVSLERVQDLRKRYMTRLDEQEGRWLCGFDDDEEGNRAAEALGATDDDMAAIKRSVPGIDHSRPVTDKNEYCRFKVWNERLVRERDLQLKGGGSGGTHYTHDDNVNQALTK